jgi:hypothetical protein
VSDPDGGARATPPPFTGRAAFAISQVYFYVAAAIGLGFFVGGGIAALIGLRQLVFGASPGDLVDGSYVGIGSSASRDAVRSILGGVAFAVPGAAVFLWHLREARRGESRPITRTFWGAALYFHLVALIALPVAMGGLVAGLHSLRDAALPYCYSVPAPYPPIATPIPGISPGVEIEIPEEALEELRRNCYPLSGEALRSAFDAAIVTIVGGGVWWWHLRRGPGGAPAARRLTGAPYH